MSRREYGYSPSTPIPVVGEGRSEAEYRDGMCRPCHGFRGYHTCEEKIDTDTGDLFSGGSSSDGPDQEASDAE